MNYGYCRVSSDLQSNKNQEYEILKFASDKKISIDEWVVETVSGTKDYQSRMLGDLIKNKCVRDDIICISEISRLGRSLMMIFNILNECLEKGIKVLSVKEGFSLDSGITSSVITFAWGLCSQLERNLISERTKNSLALRKSQGMILGRPRGSFSKSKLSGHENEIKELLAKKISICSISRIYGCNPGTVSAFCQTRKLLPPKEVKQK